MEAARLRVIVLRDGKDLKTVGSDAILLMSVNANIQLQDLALGTDMNSESLQEMLLGRSALLLSLQAIS